MFLKLASLGSSVVITGMLGAVVMAKQSYKRLLGIRSLFDHHINDHVHDYGGFHVPSNVQRKFKAVLFWRIALNRPHLFQSLAQQLHEDFLRYIKEKGWMPRPCDEVDCVDWKKIESDREGFYNDYVIRQKPCVIKGFPVDSGWSIEGIRRIWGDKPMMVHEMAQGARSLEMTLNEMIDHNRSGGCAYMSFNRTFFDANRGLLEQLYPDKLIEALKKSKSDERKIDAQLFISTDGPMDMYPGSPMHCANNINMFFNLEGGKNWILIDPEFSFACYPYSYIRRKGVMLGLISYGNIMREDDSRDLFPLLKYVPRYSVDLTPGDVLFVPCWWWHSVETLSKDTLSVAMRLGPVAFGSLFPVEMKDPNSLFTTLQVSSFGLYREIFQIVYTRTLSKLSSYSGAQLRKLDLTTETEKDSAGVYSADRMPKIEAWTRPAKQE